jgi:hypothetical protein
VEAFSQQFVVFFVSSYVSIIRSFFVSGFLLHEVRERSVLECQTVRDGADGPWVHRRRSIIEGAVLEVRGLFSDSPSQPRVQSAKATRTAR